MHHPARRPARRSLASVLLLLATCTSPDSAPPDSGPPGTDAPGADLDAAPSGPARCAASATAPSPGGATYHVSPTGDDKNPGTSPAAPLKTIAAALGKAAAGDVVRLAPGATFNEAIDIQPGKGGAPGRPIVVSSDPQSRARIVVPAGKSGINIHNASALTFENLILAGPGMNSTRAVGVYAQADGGRFTDLAFRNLDVSGFNQGLEVISYLAASDGFTGVLIEGVALHHNLQGGGSTYGLAAGSLRDVVVRCSSFHHNPGDPTVKRPSGDGFVLGGVDGGLIDGCVAYNNGGQGTNSAGPVGLWAYSSNRVTIQFSESHHNLALLQDGDGFDLDIATTNSVIQYCYSHDNYGAGYLLSQAGNSPWSNNVVRYNISQNDAAGKKLGAVTFYSDPTGLGLTDAYVYGNTIYAAVGPALNLTSAGNAAGLRVFNNIFVTARDQQLVWDWSGSAPAGIMQIQGNLYFASGGKVDLQGYPSFDAWRAARGHEVLGGKPVGLFADPLLTQPGGGGSLDDPSRLTSLAAYRLLAGSPALDAGLDPRRFGVDPGARDYYGTPLPQGVGYDLGAHERRP